MAAEVKAPPSPWIRGFSTEPDGFWTECKYMYGRVFHPSQTPIRIEAYTKSHQGDAGFIGTDQKKKYYSQLTTFDGKQISLQPSDFHITFDGHEIKAPLILRIIELVLKKLFFFIQRKRPIEDPWVLPSPLFNQAQENNIIQFRWEGTLYEYRLKQQAHFNCRGNFEDVFKALQEHVEHKASVGNPYLFDEDVPQEYCRELGKLFSDKAQIYLPANKTSSPLTPDKLKQLIEHKSKAEQIDIAPYIIINENHFAHFDAPGISESNLDNITLLLDDHYLAVFLYTPDTSEGKIIENSRNDYTYGVLRLDALIDSSTLELTFTYGRGHIKFKKTRGNSHSL